MLLNNSQFRAVKNLRAELKNNEVKQLVNDSRTKKILELKQLLLTDGYSINRLQELSQLPWYRNDLSITNIEDLAFHIASDFIKYYSNVSLKADAKKFLYDWRTKEQKIPA